MHSERRRFPYTERVKIEQTQRHVAALTFGLDKESNSRGPRHVIYAGDDAASAFFVDGNDRSKLAAARTVGDGASLLIKACPLSVRGR